MFERLAKRGGFLIALGFISAYGWMALRGPQGIQALEEKHLQIRQLEEQNAATALDNARRREHIRLLKESPSAQDMEIRKQLKLLRPGEVTFILPDAPKEDTTKEKGPGQDPQ